MRKNSPFTWYHGLIAGATMLTGALLIGGGVYLKLRDPLQNIKLSFTSNSVLNGLLSLGYIAIAIGILCILISMIGVAVSKSSGRCLFLVIYMVLLLSVIVALVMLSVFLLQLSSGKTLFSLDKKLESAWETTVTKDKEAACKIQVDYDCFGFSDGFCAGCGRLNSEGQRVCEADKVRQCPVCDGTLAGNERGCYDEILGRTKSVWRPIGIGAAVLAAVLLLDVVIVCAIR